jgi:hypothetical protein
MAEKTFSKISVLSVISSIYILSVNYGGRQTSYKMQGPWRPGTEPEKIVEGGEKITHAKQHRSTY